MCVCVCDRIFLHRVEARRWGVEGGGRGVKLETTNEASRWKKGREREIKRVDVEMKKMHREQE